MRCNRLVKLISPVPKSVLDRVSPAIEEGAEGVFSSRFLNPPWLRIERIGEGEPSPKVN